MKRCVAWFLKGAHKFIGGDALAHHVLLLPAFFEPSKQIFSLWTVLDLIGRPLVFVLGQEGSSDVARVSNRPNRDIFLVMS